MSRSVQDPSNYAVNFSCDALLWEGALGLSYYLEEDAAFSLRGGDCRG